MSDLVFCSNCERVAKYRGLKLCARCYQRFRTHGDFNLHTKEKSVCLGADCPRPVKHFGWCKMHWDRLSKHDDPEYDGKWARRDSEGCAIPACGGRHRAMGLCARHYSAEMKRGHPVWRTPGRRKIHGDRPWTEDRVQDFELLMEWMERVRRQGRG